MKREYKIEEKFNPKEKNIEEILQEIFITFLLEKSQEIEYNHSSWIRGTNCYQKGET